MSRRRPWVLAEAGRRILAMASFVVVARWLSVSAFAEFALLTAGFSIVLMVLQSSLDRLQVRLWITDSSAATFLGRASFWAAIGVWVVAAIGAAVSTQPVVYHIALYGIASAGQVGIWTVETRERSAGRLANSNRLRTASDGLPAVGRLVGAIATGSIDGVLIAGAVAALPLYVLAVRHRFVASGKTDIRSTLKLAGSASGIGIAAAVAWRLDLFLLAGLATPAAVAGYAIVIRVLDVVLVVPSIYGQLAISSLVRGAEDQRVELRYGRTVFWLGAGIGALGLVLAIPLAGAAAMLFDKNVDASVVALLSGTIPVAFLGGVLGNYVFAHARERLLLNVSVLMLITNAALNLVLIPRFGATGAAAATTITELAGVSVLVMRLRTIVPLSALLRGSSPAS